MYFRRIYVPHRITYAAVYFFAYDHLWRYLD